MFDYTKYETDGIFDISKMNYPCYIVSKTSFDVIQIDGPITDSTKSYKLGKGYMRSNGDVYVYTDNYKEDRRKNRVPLFWTVEGKTYFYSKCDTPSQYTYKHMSYYDPISIAAATKPDEVLYDEKALSDLNAASSIFTPVINEYDDFLKRLVKLVILDKHVNITRYKGKMSTSYSIPNMRTALENRTKMSVPFFNTWSDLLGFNFTLTAVDSGADRTNPLKRSITYNSLWDTFTYEDGTPVVYKVGLTQKEKEEAADK